MSTRSTAFLSRYTVKQAAQLSGFHPITIRKYISNGWIPGCEKKGRTYLIRREPFDQWVQKGMDAQEVTAA